MNSPANQRLMLPELVLLEAYGGNFPTYLEAVYSWFRKDFIESKPVFRGVKLGLKKMPYYEGKEATFWHLTSEGAEEEKRIPDMRRMERIRWPRPIIDSSEHPDLKVWRNKRGSDERILIWHVGEDYLVVLADRGSYILPWTAYLVTQDHRRAKLKREYDAFKKAEAAQRN